MPRLLVVEDEPKLLRALCRGLEAEGYVVIPAADGNKAITQFANRPSIDAIILDWMLPGQSGVEVLKQLRRDGHSIPVLMLTARDAIGDRVTGLDEGADDYLVKPFEFAELLARVRSLLRRGQGGRETVLTFADLSVDLLERRVTRAGHTIELRAKEYEVLVFLLRRQGVVVPRNTLGLEIWDDPDHALTNVIDVTMANLRKALDRGGPPLIHTIRGVGFVLREMQ